MKKQYLTPESEVIMTETAEILCISTPIGGDANEPACAPLFDGDWD